MLPRTQAQFLSIKIDLQSAPLTQASVYCHASAHTMMTFTLNFCTHRCSLSSHFGGQLTFFDLSQQNLHNVIQTVSSSVVGLAT